MTETSTKHTRTLGTNLLMLLALLAGAAAVVDVLRFLGLLPIADMWGLSLYDRNWLGALLSGLVALIWFMTAVQIWHLDPRGWLFVVIIAIVELVFLGLSAIGGSTWQAVLPGVVLCGLVILVSMLTSTRVAFGTVPAE